MLETPVMQRVCNLCGTEMDDARSENTCPDCVKVLGTVVIVPAPTAIRSIRPSAPALAGIFGDYEIVSEIASGGMGVVYAARQISLNRRVALKMILTPFARPEQIRRFQAEAEHAATLEHPNIVPIYDSGSIHGVPYFSMKLIQGRGLNEELRRLVLNPRKGVAIMATIARAVHFAHARGILHRDLKPANILIDEQGVPYVGDFGISKRVGTTDGMTREGAVIGTPYYMAPEQASGVSAALTTSADVYGLGAIFYEILTLRAPFYDADPDDILRKVKSEDPAAPRTLRAGVNRDLETICLKCLEKSPARRYPSAEALACDLERWLQNEPIAARPHSRVERAVKWARRRPAVACSAGLAVLLALLVLGFSWHSQNLVHRADLAKIEERRLAAAVAVDAGSLALYAAREALAKNRASESEDALMQAEDRFRAALVYEPEDEAAITGLRETALLNFDASLRAKNYRQAREKLLLARSAQLGNAGFDRMGAQLARQESERGDHIRARVKALMDDAASVTRRVTQEDAVSELITLKDPLTLELLSDYAGHERAQCRVLACSALAWIGDASVVPLLQRNIQPRTPSGEVNPHDVQIAALNAICMLAADDDTGAYQAVTGRYSQEPGDNASVLYNGIRLHFEEFARRQAQRMTGDGDATPEKQSAQGLRLRDSHAYREALAIFDRLVAEHPGNMTFVNERGNLRLETQDFKGALEDGSRVIAALPNQKEGYVLHSTALKMQQDYAGALRDLDKGVELAPNDFPLRSSRGGARVAVGDFKGALEDYDYVLDRNQDELYALTNRASLRAQMKDYTHALVDYDRVLALSPLFYQALYGRGCTRFEIKDIDGAIADFDKVLTFNPNDKNCYYNRGTMRMGRQEYKEALRDFDRFIELDATSGRVFYNRGLTKQKLNDLNGAVKDYRKAIELEPSRADAMVNCGNIVAGQGNYDEARKLFDRALQTDPKKREAWDRRAELNYCTGNSAKAVSDMKTAISLLPENAMKVQRDDYAVKLAKYEAAANDKK